MDQGSNADGDITSGGWSSEQKQIGYVYRIGYNFDEKYMLEIAGRYDGHYYFAPGKRFGFFPSYSLGWNIAKEGFIANNIKWIDLLKLRCSYGESGNLAGEAFQYLTGYGIYSSSAYFNGTKTAGIYETKQGNPEITWERATKFDVGFEGSLWQGKLRFETDYFYEKRYDMLTTPDVTVPLEYGVELTQVNGGIMSNHGFEISLGTSFSLFNEIKFSFDGNFTFAENKLLEVYETEVTYDNPNRRRTGRANGTQFGLQALGYFTPDDFYRMEPLNQESLQ
ncbi:MAG: TonB-dependent receptor [Cyclobacteriaceae bacterium]|nr:TonB-dependent receptor [Cyclobacteriaceae bacterium]